MADRGGTAPRVVADPGLGFTPLLGPGSRSTITPYIRRAGRFGDVSYGVYLWGFPIQQLVWQAWPQLNLGVNLVLVLAFTLAVAFASWHLIEKRALSAVRNRLHVTTRTCTIPTPADAECENG